MQPTIRLYLTDDHCYETEAVVVGIDDHAVACDRTCIYPGGGGQPPDTGFVRIPGGELLSIASAHADGDEIIWHRLSAAPSTDLVGRSIHIAVDGARRQALTRYHTVLHVLNTIALRKYDGWITGVQIGTDYSRIDFKIEGFSPALCAELETQVNAVLQAGHALKAYTISQAEFEARSDLLRTLEVKPPVVHGRIRVVEIEGFDAQACGGTHVHNTAHVGRFSIFRTENKGRINKRLYVRLEQPA
jgi:misacylated tRNA(Ala) deacylase